MSGVPSVAIAELQAEVARQVAALHADCGDPFRRTYTVLSDEQVQLMNRIKDEAISTYALVEAQPPSRLRALALTYLELGVMLAVKAVTEPEGRHD